MPPRRHVAVVVAAGDVLDPASDLHRVAGSAAEVDVLVARTDDPVDRRHTSPLDAPDYPLPVHLDDGDDDGDGADAGDGPGNDPGDGADDTGGADVGDGAGRRRRGGVRLHHLGLRWRVQDADEPDLVAALSELVGFDPDDGVFCVSPAGAPDRRARGEADDEADVLARAVRRVATVYGLPVLRYHAPGDAGRHVAPLTRPEPVA